MTGKSCFSFRYHDLLWTWVVLLNYEKLKLKVLNILSLSVKYINFNINNNIIIKPFKNSGSAVVYRLLVNMVVSGFVFHSRGIDYFHIVCTFIKEKRGVEFRLSIRNDLKAKSGERSVLVWGYCCSYDTLCLPCHMRHKPWWKTKSTT